MCIKTHTQPHTHTYTYKYVHIHVYLIQKDKGIGGRIKETSESCLEFGAKTFGVLQCVSVCAVKYGVLQCAVCYERDIGIVSGVWREDLRCVTVC